MRYNGKAMTLFVVGLALVAFASMQAGPARAPAPRAEPGQATSALDLPRTADGTPRNVIFVLTDDHRYDALGFLHAQSFIQTPNLDRLAAGGVYAPNAFVTTALCSPSRASILTGLYAHRHRVVDNQNPVSPDLVFFPQYLQRVGYETAFVGKWHMGEGGGSDEPQRGFDYWVSFAGQGHYLPHPDGLNVNGRRVPQRGYITDELTQYAVEWLRARRGDRPFFLYLSHKGVHADFVPAERHEGRFAAHRFVAPKTMAKGACADQPMWVQNQRNSWHGVEFPYHSRLDIGAYYKRYAETLLGVDESVGRVMDYLREAGLLDSTLVIYMGDNGFAFGEHGLIDKRTAYEESMRVPLLMHCPRLLEGGTRLPDVVANIDIAPTILEAVGLRPPAGMDGRSFLTLARGERAPWREALLYEYFWERNFPHTPTLHALRGDRYKYVRSHGVWDIDELYDLAADPLESKNLIRSAAHRDVAEAMNRRLFETLAASGGMYIALNRDSGGQMNLRDERASGAAPFPAHLLRARAPEPASRRAP